MALPCMMTLKRTGATRSTCLGQSCGCRARSAISNGAGAGVGSALGGGSGVEAGGAVSVGAGVSALTTGAGAGLGAASTGVGGGTGVADAVSGAEVGVAAAGAGTALGAGAGSGTEAMGPLVSQLGFGWRLDQIQNPTLSRAHKMASRARGPEGDVCMVLISRIPRANRKRNSFCQSNPIP